MEDNNQSKTYGNMQMMQIESYYGEARPNYAQTQMGTNNKDLKLKKGKSKSSISKSWSLADPELQRKKRVANYKMYSVEGKVKGSFSKSFKWLKDRYWQMVYGLW